MENFKYWLKIQEDCGLMGCPGHPFKPENTPQGRAAKIYKYKLDNSGCSGGPCSGGSSSAAPAPMSAKMKKK